jgi:tRNA1Val (adenine37-N6)-methyltransferase
MEKMTSDSFFNGRLLIHQDQAGYRFSIDAVLLAYYARPHPGERVLDLGTGCGIIPLIMAFRYPDIKIYAVEIQKELSDLAAFNIRENRMLERITILCKDLKALKPAMIAGRVDLVVCNPPYRRSDSGRINPDHQRAIARHEIKATLPDVILTSRRMLQSAGRLVVVYTAQRTAELFMQMRANQIEPKIFRSVHAKRHSDAKLVLVEGVKDGRPGIQLKSPLILYDEAGDSTLEMKRIFEP